MTPEFTASRENGTVTLAFSNLDWGWANYEQRALDGGFEIKDPDALFKVLPFTFTDYAIRAEREGFEIKDPDALDDGIEANRLIYLYRADEYRANYTKIAEIFDSIYVDEVTGNAKYKAAFFDGLQIGRRSHSKYALS